MQADMHGVILACIIVSHLYFGPASSACRQSACYLASDRLLAKPLAGLPCTVPDSSPAQDYEGL